MKAQSIDPVPYLTIDPSNEDAIIAQALRILDSRIRTGPIFDSPARVKDHARVYFAQATADGREEFACLFLDSSHRLIACETLFRGTLSQTSIYPREIVRRALALNAGAVVFAHNHPSGASDPSRADEMLTRVLKDALTLVDVRTLDHLVVGATVTSFAERGML